MTGHACAIILAALLLGALPRPARAQDEYGAKGLFPVYDHAGTWLVYDKTSKKGASSALMPGSRFLIVGSRGADLFSVARASATYGGACRGRKPLRLRAAILKGPREEVCDPILAIKVPTAFSLKGSRALYAGLPNKVDEAVYGSLGAALAAAAVSEAKDGAFQFKLDDEGASAFLADPKPEKILLKIDYASRPKVAGLADPLVLVTGAQISNSFRRCLRLADGDKLVGGCVEMPSGLMAETSLLRFVSYDPGGKGNPFLLAYTREAPLWGHERWGVVLRAAGARLFLRDAMDPRCREGF
ncbi:MAG: hypothetical protein A2V88_08595 [Elusimicrobia bacterium RBG_16_66_12]|nr:MAG: hypothetical protein A2V88_08595 [Elusimicrobia bacterium RBG_16_66_12]